MKNHKRLADKSWYPYLVVTRTLPNGMDISLAGRLARKVDTKLQNIMDEVKSNDDTK